MATGPVVLVVGELSENQLSLSTKEGIAVASTLAKTLAGSAAVALLSNSIPDEVGREAISSGADVVYKVEDSHLEQVNFDAWVAALEKLCLQEKPAVVLMARNQIGRDVAPRLAFRLGTGLLQDCMELWIDEESKCLTANRPVYGGSAVATIVHKGAVQVATFRVKVHDPLEPDPARQGDVSNFVPSLEPEQIRVKVIQKIQQQAEGVRLEDARVVVGGGRGLGGPEPFEQLEGLARLLGGAVGASRAVCDAGWLPSSYQIGLTGKTITPDLYITVAISGASQHMAGCSGSKTIVAINKDPEANIFRESRYGVVGDWTKVLPAFIEKIQELGQG